ncbi:unnamed protein product, partial [Mesorhabditis belari]|uniref:Uncharacterized protein n=1 Tax=Mesorhabditis belari TaxID=2138241 RepID=A0AAF3F0Y3_9BILA
MRLLVISLFPNFIFELASIVINQDYDLVDSSSDEDSLHPTQTIYRQALDRYKIQNEQPKTQPKPQRKPPNCTRDTVIMHKLINETGYNKLRIPTDEGVRVVVEFWIQSIESINEITNDFEMDIYINEMWMDPALTFEHLNPCKQNFSLSFQIFDQIWTPNSCFINSKIAEIHNSPFRNVFLMLYPNGTVWVNYRTRVKGPCSLDLTMFPLDRQRCSLIYESFNYNNQEVQMRWSTDQAGAVKKLVDIVLPDFDLIDIRTDHVVEPYPAGMWDELHVHLTFERRYIWYFMQAYLPTYLTIFISWVSFALGPRAIPARTMLGVNALLAMIFQFGNIMRNLPRVSYIKAIDVWMLASMTFIFASLLELAIVGYMVKDEMPGSRKRKSLCVPKISRSYQMDTFDSTSANLIRIDKRFMLPLDRARSAWRIYIPDFGMWPPERVDKISSILFPTTFAVFNIVYWTYYSQRKITVQGDG